MQTPTWNNVLRSVDVYTTHTHPPMQTQPKTPLFLSSLLRMLRNLSVICGWLELVSSLQKLTILLPTSSSFPECRVGGKTCPALFKRHIQGHEYFYQLHKIWHSLTASKTKKHEQFNKNKSLWFGNSFISVLPMQNCYGHERNRFWWFWLQRKKIKLFQWLEKLQELLLTRE